LQRSLASWALWPARQRSAARRLARPDKDVGALSGSTGQISDLSPGYSGSSVYPVDVATPPRLLPSIVKLIPDRGDDAAWPEDARLTDSRTIQLPVKHLADRDLPARPDPTGPALEEQGQ
jgi:hypothetical protein